MGAICSLLLLALVLVYAGYKASILEGRKSIDILTAVTEDYFNETYVFGAN